MAIHFMRGGSLPLKAPKKDGITEIERIAGFPKQQKIPAFDKNCCSSQQDTQIPVKEKFSSSKFKDLPALVSEHRGLRIGLKSPEGHKVRITGLDGTVYWGRDRMLETWGKLYLPQPEKMAVMGTIDNAPSLAEGLQLIVLVDSQLKVYFYESEVLHLVALSVKDFLFSGAASAPMESFKYGQYCAPKTEEEYLRVMKETGIPLIQKATWNFVQSKKKGMEDNLDFLARLGPSPLQANIVDIAKKKKEIIDVHDVDSPVNNEMSGKCFLIVS